MTAVATKPAAVDDWRLLAAVMAGNAAAREHFGRLAQATMRRYFEWRWHGSPVLALRADAVQEAMVECLRPDGALARIEPERFPGLAAYLRGVARNVAARVERREARYAAHCGRSADNVFSPTPVNSDPPNSLTAEHTRESIGHAVDLLDGEPAAAGHSLGEFTRLHFFEGLAVRHIATRWRQPTARMHELRRRACRRLRLLLEPLQR